MKRAVTTRTAASATKRRKKRRRTQAYNNHGHTNKAMGTATKRAPHRRLKRSTTPRTTPTSARSGKKRRKGATTKGPGRLKAEGGHEEGTYLEEQGDRGEKQERKAEDTTPKDPGHPNTEEVEARSIS